MKINWEYANIDKITVNNIAKKFNISKGLACVLYNRGLYNEKDIERFISKDINRLYEPFSMPDMESAVKRINYAIENNEKIVVYGDYDVDGITSTSVLVDYLRGIGASVDYYIPDRIEEGYGLNSNALTYLKNKGAQLIITVDTGITAIEEAKLLQDYSIDLIITDHHECIDTLPEAVAVINPKRNDSDYPYTELAGVGVIFKVIHALGGIDAAMRYCDIVSLGTIADVVPLLDENRIIVSNGLERLANTNNIGLKLLIKSAGLECKKLNASTVGFVIAPRINAAGRIGDANMAVELFLTKDIYRAEEIVNELNNENKRRQKTEAEILNEVLEIVEKNKYHKNKVIVIKGQQWHNGIIGIVASRITEKYYRPCILINCENKVGKGSGRSIKGFNLFKALSNCSQIIDKFGGHELAAGLTLKENNIDILKKELINYADNQFDDCIFTPSIFIDYEAEESDLNREFAKELEILEPYGMGNPSPVFSINDAVIYDIRKIGDGKHIKLILNVGQKRIDAIGFNMASIADEYIPGDRVDISFKMSLNNYNGMEKVQLLIKDVKISDNRLIKYNYYKTIEGLLQSDIIDLLEKNLNNKKSYNYITYDNAINEIISQKEQKSLIIVYSLKTIVKILKSLKGIYKNIHFTNINTKKNTSTIDILVNPLEFQEYILKYDNIYVFNYLFINNIDESKFKNKLKIVENNYKEFNSTFFDNLIPERKDFVAVYQYIKSRSNYGKYKENIFLLTRKIQYSYNIDMNVFKLKKCIEIFDELNLMTCELNNNSLTIKLNNELKNKVNIERSLILKNLRKIKDLYFKK